MTVVVQKKGLNLYLRLDPGTLLLEEGFSRDMRGRGHWGTGDLELWVPDKASLKKALPLIISAYEAS